MNEFCILHNLYGVHLLSNVAQTQRETSDASWEQLLWATEEGKKLQPFTLLPFPYG